MKIVINRCHGGFGLSNAAFEKLLERKGIAFDCAPGKAKMVGNDYYEAGHSGDRKRLLFEFDYYEHRNDPDLIAVVEEMGESSHSWAAELRIVEIPDDVEWEIAEYDGLEWVAEKHRTWE